MERGEVLSALAVFEGGIELVTTDGIFALDGGELEGHQQHLDRRRLREVVVFDAADDHQPIVDAVNGRRVAAIVLTHGHNDHIDAAVPRRDAVDAAILLHDADRMLWDVAWTASHRTGRRRRGSICRPAGTRLVALHWATPRAPAASMTWCRALRSAATRCSTRSMTGKSSASSGRMERQIHAVQLHSRAIAAIARRRTGSRDRTSPACGHAISTGAASAGPSALQYFSTIERARK